MPAPTKKVFNNLSIPHPPRRHALPPQTENEIRRSKPANLVFRSKKWLYLCTECHFSRFRPQNRPFLCTAGAIFRDVSSKWVLVRTEACFYATYPQNRSNLRTTLSVRASTSRDFRERIILVATPVSTNKSSNDGTVIRVKRKKTHSCYPT